MLAAGWIMAAVSSAIQQRMMRKFVMDSLDGFAENANPSGFRFYVLGVGLSYWW